jgi:hypothetical protein
MVSAGAAFEEDVVGQHDRGPAVLLEDGEDVLEEIELVIFPLPFVFTGKFPQDDA